VIGLVMGSSWHMAKLGVTHMAAMWWGLALCVVYICLLILYIYWKMLQHHWRRKTMVSIQWP